MRNLWLSLLLLLCIPAYAGEVWIDGRTNSGHIIYDEGSIQNQQPLMDFVGPAVVASESSSTSTTTITINASTSSAPTNAGDSCAAGTIAYDTDFIYICRATDTWERTAIATWAVTDRLLLDDGASHLLLDDGASKLLIR